MTEPIGLRRMRSDEWHTDGPAAIAIYLSGRQLVDAVRHIEIYRTEAALAGRKLDGQQATLEWFNLYAGEFFKGRTVAANRGDGNR